MSDRANAYLRHQQARWLRCDAAHWVRPDAAKFLKPGTDVADVYPALAQQRDARQRQHEREIAEAIARERAALDALRQDLAEINAELARHAAERKYNEDQPRVPAGNTGGGQWTSGGGSSSGRPRVYITTTNPDDEVGDGGSSISLPMGSLDVGDIASEIDKLDLFDIKPQKPRSGGVRLAGEPPDGLGAPDDKPPKVPAKRPKKSSQVTGVLRAITSFARKYPTIAGDLIAGLINNSDWLDAYDDLIEADRDAPKTMRELQAGVGQRRPGYDTHHIVEQTAAEYWGLTRSEIDDPSNLVSIPRLRHYQITGWYGKKNADFGRLSPREYLSDKDPAERRRVGLDALILFKVLKP